MYTCVYLSLYIRADGTPIHSYIVLHISQKKNYLQAQTNQVTVNETETTTTTQKRKIMRPKK